YPASLTMTFPDCILRVVRCLAGVGFVPLLAMAAEEKPVHFANDIVPILTKQGCNSGGCHGRASGQNGFKLSLFGYEAMEDYDHIVREGRGRRISPAAPEQSLLLLKATNTVPHNGGKRLDASS